MLQGQQNIKKCKERSNATVTAQQLVQYQSNMKCD